MVAVQPHATAPLLHRFLGIGLVLIALAAGSARYFGIASTEPRDEFTAVMAYAFSGIAAALIAVAFIVFKPRVPEPKPGQTVEAYWSTPAVASKAMLVWFLMEGGAMMAVLGFFLTGEPVAAAAAVLGVAAFWLSGPSVFAQA